MSFESKLSMMQEQYNAEETKRAQEYKNEFMYRVLSEELVDPHVCELSTDTLIETSDANNNDNEFFVALRKYILSHNNHFFNYVRIATDHQCNHAGRESVKILTLPFENVSDPLLTFQHMQCQLINNDFCRIRIFPLAADEYSQLSYKVNLKNGHVKRLAQNRLTHGYTSIKVWYNYRRTLPQSVDKDSLFLESHAFKLLPSPLIWNEQIFSPQKARR